MNDPIQTLRSRARARRRNGDRPAPGATGIVEYATAEILLIGGLGAAATLLRRGSSQHDSAGPADTGRLRPLALGAALFGLGAAAAHAVHAASADPRARTAGRIFDLSAVAAGLLAAAQASRRDGPAGAPTLAGLTLASAGMLGVLVDRAGRSLSAERDRLERRARLVERLVPERRPRLDRIVLHV